MLTTIILICKSRGQSDNTVDRSFALQVTKPNFSPSISYGSQALPRVIPDCIVRYKS